MIFTVLLLFLFSFSFLSVSDCLGGTYDFWHFVSSVWLSDSPYNFWRLVYSVWLSGQSLWFLTFCLVFYCLESPYDFWRLVYSVWLSGHSLWFLFLFVYSVWLSALPIWFLTFWVSYCLDSPYDFLVVYGLLFLLPLWFVMLLLFVFVCLSGQPLWFLTFCLQLSYCLDSAYDLFVWFLSCLFVVCVGGLLTSINAGLAIPVGLAPRGSVLRQLPHHHHHPLAPKQRGRARLQRLRPLLQAARGTSALSRSTERI